MNESEQKKIFVIDDELQYRKKHYEQVLKYKDRFSVVFSEKAETIYHNLDTIKVDLYIVDLNLERFIDPIRNDKLDIINIIRHIGKTKPIIILSGKYQDFLDRKRLTPTIRYFAEEGYNICSFFSWEEVKMASSDLGIDGSDYIEALHNKIDFAIFKDRKPYDFGIICALDEELAPFQDKAVSVGAVRNSFGIRFSRGIIKTKSGRSLCFIAASSQYMGIADASIIATTMVTKFSVASIFMIGVCGGRESENVKIGDIIIPKSSVAYQRGKLTNKGFSSGILTARPKELLLNYDNSKDKEILETLFTDYIAKKANEGVVPRLSRPRIINETIACADFVIDKDGELDRISELISQRKLCGVDMESFALFRAGEIHDVNTLVIKSVMDLTNQKSDEYKQYAAHMSANFLYQLLFRELICFS